MLIKYKCVFNYLVALIKLILIKVFIFLQDQQCDIDREVCCTLNHRGHTDQSAAGSFSQVQVSGSRGNSRPTGSSTSGGIFGNSYNQQQEIDLSAGDQVQQTVDDNINGYLPPIGSEPSSNVPAFSKPPQEEGLHLN